MPKLGQVTDDMQVHGAGGTHMQFSAKKIDQLGASEYTLATLIVDLSGSLSGMERAIEKMIGIIVESCRDPRNPRADNMMLRVVGFANDVVEIHGFRPVMDLNPGDYANTLNCAGMTAAFDAALNGICASNDYAAQLVQQQFAVNGAVFLITDGIDNMSKSTPKMVKAALAAGVSSEALESMMAVLIGMGSGSTQDVAQLSDALKVFHDEAGFSQYVFAGDATPQTLAKIGGFVSKSASSQSQALGTGGPSQSLKF